VLEIGGFPSPLARARRGREASVSISIPARARRVATRTVEFRFLGRPVAIHVDFRGIFGGSSADGVRADVLKSLLQKAIRRGDQARALAAFVRLLAFDNDPRAGNGGRALASNAINRLPVIAAEDV